MLCLLVLTSWGFFAHGRINRLAVFTLPAGISRFYKVNISYIGLHAVDPDKRRYSDTLEAPRHYLDVEVYEQEIDSIPRRWNDAVLKYGINKLNANGTLPWQIQKSYFNLVNAFKERDSIKILRASAFLGHYIADAHVPLHTTENHNGQLTNQHGIHAFWESRLPELFAQNYNFIVGKAKYIDAPLTEAWKIVKHSHSLVDSTLQIEKELSRSYSVRKKYSFSERKNQVLKQYAVAYSKAYNLRLNNMVERQMRAAILATGSFWYSAWIDAGQPTLEHLVKVPESILQQEREERLNNKYEGGDVKGREN
ncbi:MAG: Nuclease [Pedobacter sp.]|nr:Nuclease [Pedobacter sp.]